MLSEISLTAPVWVAFAMTTISLVGTTVWLKANRTAGGAADCENDGEAEERVMVSFRSLLRSSVVRVLLVFCVLRPVTS
ncbi:hypothetical protein J2R99_001695 [Rhodopseudomonas julia]|uniref:Secreted protein n=1 Tax=Rhodopseudomonas julia TaxID=200617 RepID=A0ABU0C5Q9_9BRAD|nr:hypothetical protein [Rhodopseudomonas julia]MDQ0325846.1 hypothetical protein [Rhodopseudomonas julia]